MMKIVGETVAIVFTAWAVGTAVVVWVLLRARMDEPDE